MNKSKVVTVDEIMSFINSHQQNPEDIKARYSRSAPKKPKKPKIPRCSSMKLGQQCILPVGHNGYHCEGNECW